MKPLYHYRPIFLLLLILSLQACKKSDSSQQEIEPLKNKLKEIQHSGSFNLLTSFYYDAKDEKGNPLLSKVDYKLNNSALGTVEFNYAGNRLTNFQERYFSSETKKMELTSNGTVGQEEGNIYNILISDVRAQPQNQDIRMEFYHGADLVRTIETSTVADGKYTPFMQYQLTYDAHQNVIKMVVYNRIDKTTMTYVLEYDNHPNPLYKLAQPVDFLSFYSRNNLLKTIATNAESGAAATTNLTYEYNAEGYPVTVNKVNGAEVQVLAKYSYY